MQSGQKTSLTKSHLEESDKEILHEQLETINEFINDITKSKLIKESAILLESSHKYDSDLTVISARLAKLFGDKISGRFIRQELDQKYKRNITKKDKDDDTPTDIYDEILFLLEDQAEALYNLTKDLRIKSKDEETKKAIVDGFDSLMHDFHESPLNYLKTLNIDFGSSSELKKLIQIIKLLDIEVDTLKELTDYRERIDIYLQLHFKILLLQGWTISGLAKKIHYSSKWISYINKNVKIHTGMKKSEVISDTFKFLEKVRHCPNKNCGLDYTKFFISLQKRSDLNIPLYPAEKFSNPKTK